MSKIADYYTEVFEELVTAEEHYEKFIREDSAIDAMHAFRIQEMACTRLLEQLGISKAYEEFKYMVKANKERG